MAAYDAQGYWDALLEAHPDERGVAYPNLAVSLNRAMYGALLASTTRLVHDHGIADGPGRVLDVGSGTGVWIDFWTRAGATSVTGLDLTQAAVDGLRRAYPGVAFERADVGGEELPVEGPFDVVSAMSVLLHITDDDRWRRAWRNISRVLRPGGHAVLIEPAVAHKWWGPAFDATSNSKARPLSEYRAAIVAAGLSLVELRPATVLLANPIDSRSSTGFDLLSRYWAALSRVVGTDEARGRAAGTVLSALDAPLRRLLPHGPTAKLMLLRRGS